MEGGGVVPTLHTISLLERLHISTLLGSTLLGIGVWARQPYSSYDDKRANQERSHGSPLHLPHEFTPRNVADDLVMLSGSHRTSLFSHDRSVQEEDHERLCRFGHLCGYGLDEVS